MRFAAIASLGFLAGCLDPSTAPPPMVSDFNGHTVKVIYHTYALGDGYRESPAYAVAAQTCGGDATYQGVRQVSQYQGEHVFLCA